MEAQLQSLLDHLVSTQFVGLSGSSANLHLEIPEKVLNEVLAELLAVQKKNYPLLGMVKAAHVKGPVIVEIEAGV
jgi:hypothetical protein